MASSSSLSTVAAASSISPSKNTSILLHNFHPATVSFRFSPNPKLPRFFTKGLQPSSRSSGVIKAQLNEVAVDGSSNAAASSKKSEPSSVEAKDSKPSIEPSPGSLATEESISEFISQVSSLVKLVDSRDIVELQLKQLDCELIIRKKEALPQPPSPPPMVMMHSPSPQSVLPHASPSPAPSPPPPSASAPSAPSLPPAAAKASKSSSPPLKCPMAGTFYRCPAPGEPPFVKVGDKVQKGQVVCIVEAMKLMNEIEADRSGTVVEVLAEDGKPVSVDTPLLVIEP